MKQSSPPHPLVGELHAVLERYRGRYANLGGSRRLDRYLAAPGRREDEELLTEPILADVLERVLGFPPDTYFPQLGRSGSKPDFTPVDLVAHRFVLDAKSSLQDLAAHEPQIRRYIDERRLDFGVLFNLRELRVYRRGRKGHEPGLSFPLLPLWQVARGEAMPGAEVDRLLAFHEIFRHREMATADKVERIRRAPRWRDLESGGEKLEIDVDYLVDRLRDLSRDLAADAAAEEDTLERQARLRPELGRGLTAELRLLVLDLAPGSDLETLPGDVPGFRFAEAGSLPARAWQQYLLRVSQLALTRIVLYRAWEDAGFVDERLYDGGFGRLYDQLGHRVRDVLREAFAAGQERYRWLYGADNTYDWYRPREEVLVDVLYSLVPVPLGRLDADVLGGLYESYVDEIDRDRLGQFYTPRSVVRFMLDRAGFAGPEGVFRLEGDERRPRRVFDFATGSGGFVVEAARRIVDEVVDGDVRALDEGLLAIVGGILGSEISPFPYYLTEVNLLLQVSRLLGALRARGEDPGSFVLGIVHTDTLTTRQAPNESLSGLAAGDRADRAELVPDERFGLVPLDAAKHEAFRRLREDAAFDLVIGNPPYVFESNNRVLFERLRSIPAWSGSYRGKSDYLYYFLALAAEKVAPGGRFCVITPAGWMNAGNAGWLREKLAGLLQLDELFLFGSSRLFAPDREHRRGGRRRAPVPTVESAILLATRGPAPPGHALKVILLEDVPAAARALSGDEDARVPDRELLLEEMARRADGRAGRARGILVHRLPQARLEHAVPWPIKHGERDVGRQVVAHLDRALTAVDVPVGLLEERWHIFQGVQTGADAYSARIQRRLPAEVKRRLAEEGHETGDPILELPPGAETRSPWSEHPELLARSPEPRAVLYGALDDDDDGHLVWVDRGEPVPDDVVAALEPWKPVLASRAEVVRNSNRRWYETAWPRDKAQLRRPKVIALYRTDRGRFALDETGAWQPSIKLTLCTAKGDGLSVAYLCGLLNSELLDLWYAVRGKTPWHVRRNYEPKPMARIPYRHVVPDATGPRVPRLTRMLAREDHEMALALTRDIADLLAADPSSAPEAAAALETLVRALAENRRALLPFRPRFARLGAVVKDPWRAPTLPPVLSSFVTDLPTADMISVRLDPALHLTLATNGPLGRASLIGGELRFTRARTVTATLTGPVDRLALLADLVAGRPKLLPSELETIRLPKELYLLSDRIREDSDRVVALLDHGRSLVEQAERIVCRLYAVSQELEDEVVAHAVTRAARGESPVEE